jgi:hypothetical protein
MLCAATPLTIPQNLITILSIPLDFQAHERQPHKNSSPKSLHCRE